MLSWIDLAQSVLSRIVDVALEGGPMIPYRCYLLDNKIGLQVRRANFSQKTMIRPFGLLRKRSSVKQSRSGRGRALSV